MEVDFCVDEIATDGVHGWAWCPADPSRPLSIEITGADGEPRAHAVADLYRDDLAAHGKRGGWCGFQVALSSDTPSGTYSLRARSGDEMQSIGDPFHHDGASNEDDAIAAPGPEDASGPVSGFSDGIRGGEIAGWAWRPNRPEETIKIEICIDGIVYDTVDADHYRSDLRIAGIGHGRYGWRAKFPRLPAHQTVQVVVRERDGEPLANGVFRHPPRPIAEDLEDPEVRAFVDAVFSVERPVPHLAIPETAPAHFLIHAPDGANAATVEAFRPVLEAIGHVHDVADPASWQAEALLDAALERGESCVMLSFATPDLVPLGLRCPVVPMFAWGYPTIPDHDRDWRHVLRQTGRAITFSEWAAAGIRASLGADYPVAAIPAPLRDRNLFTQQMAAPSGRTQCRVTGIVLDTRSVRFGPEDELPVPPDTLPTSETILSIDGIVFTMILTPTEADKHWLDAVSAFLAAHREHADATLVIRMLESDHNVWWWDFHVMLARQAASDCRIVVLHGDMDDESRQQLVTATHWIVDAPRSEGQSLPLQQYMGTGRPAIAPAHTVFADYINAENALIIVASEECGGWPGDTTGALTTTRYRIDWESLRDCFAVGYREARSDPASYRDRAKAARETMERYCGDAVVASKLDAFLGLGLGVSASTAPPSPLLAEAATA